jgi:hypothetical protein
MSYSNQQLNQAIDSAFDKYDKDNSNFIEERDVYSLICDALKHLNARSAPSQQVVKAHTGSAQKSKDNKIAKA